MTEVIVITDDDLEEGEILEEVESIEEPVVEIKPKPRCKKLPRRYVLHENKDINSKHSKHHRKTSHHHRKHHKCPRHLEHNKLGSNQSSSSKTGSSRSHHKESPVSSTLSSLKSAFKNYSSPRREPVNKHCRSSQKSPNRGITLPQIPIPVPTHDEPKGKEDSKINNDVSKESSLSKQENVSLSISKPEPNTPSIKLDESYKLVQIEEDEAEDEDEEELRRIALATYIKLPDSDSALVSEKCKVVNNVNKDQCSSNKAMNQLLNNCDIYLPGNNEVVDMELDSDCSTEDVESRLFIIDKTPLNSNSNRNLPEQKLSKSPTEPHPRVKSSSNHEFLLSNSQNLSTNDIEEAALRAQVIASMRSKQHTKEVPLKPFPPLAFGNTNKVLPSPKNRVPAVQNRKVVRSIQPYFKSVNFLNMTRKRVVNKAKLNYMKALNHKRNPLLPQRKINAGPERLVITLNNDSSSEESDEENDQDKGTLENASIASIEALISDARQKSDFVKNNDSTNVSCLSKAQQEEYNNLKKILAEKEVMTKKAVVDLNKARALQLKVLSREVLSAQNNLNKEIDMLTNCEKELIEKKQEYITSKLKAQLLKEQLHAAEVVRASSLEAWKKTAAKLDIQKKSISKHKAIVDLLQKKLDSKQLPPENSVLSSKTNLNLAT